MFRIFKDKAKGPITGFLAVKKGTERFCQRRTLSDCNTASNLADSFVTFFSSLVQVRVQVQLGAQVEVEEGVNPQQEDQQGHDHQDNVLKQGTIQNP